MPDHDPVSKIQSDWGIRKFTRAGRRKPVDLWLALGSAALGALLFILPRASWSVLVCLTLTFAVLVHPVWNFWWIENSLIRRCFAIVTLACVCISVGYISWPEGQQKKLTGDITYCYTNRSSAPGKTLVLVIAQIRNNGAVPTSALNYELDFLRPDSTRIHAVQLTPDRKTVPPAITDEMLKYGWLNLLTQAKPLATGAVATGFLSFEADVDVSKISGNKTKCVLSFQDVSGNGYSIEGESKEGGGGQIPTLP